jgi:hypothetical protein
MDFDLNCGTYYPAARTGYDQKANLPTYATLKSLRIVW